MQSSANVFEEIVVIVHMRIQSDPGIGVNLEIKGETNAIANFIYFF
jgi:hypothetical protein